MEITVFPPSSKHVARFSTRFGLQQDNWNDRSFQTLYHLYYRKDESPESVMLIGAVKILRKGQTSADFIQIKEDFDALSPEYCSVGQSLDYYQRLNELSPKRRTFILRALRDAVSQKKIQDQFKDEVGWRVSVFRDDPNPEIFLREARAILYGRFTALPELDNKLVFKPTGWSDPLHLDFDAAIPDWYSGRSRRIGPKNRRVLLPRRVIVVIGRNGSGKSTLLSRMARVAFASPDERSQDDIKDLGAFDPPSIGFMRIIAISYSAFDSFIVPGTDAAEVSQLADDLERGGGRYVYSGLRDIVAEARNDVEKAESNTEESATRRKIHSTERRTSTHLKSLDVLADEFAGLAKRIAENNDGDLLDSALQPILEDASFADLESRDFAGLVGDDPKGSFLRWSTGHKIIMHVVASLVAHATERALVLFDEPETHLHPPLIAALMSAVRIILETKNAFAVVATHSPVVLQETLATHVRRIRRVGDTFSISEPRSETFGENVGTLTYDTFGLTGEATDFHEVLDLLVKGCDTVDEVNRLFQPSLSGQALAYVMAGFADKERRDAKS